MVPLVPVLVAIVSLRPAAAATTAAPHQYDRWEGQHDEPQQRDEEELLRPRRWQQRISPAVIPGPPSLEELAKGSQWVEYQRGLHHPSDPAGWRPPRHGIALPTSNSLLGSVIADENVLAVRDITMPPFTSGPWSSVARNTSRLCRLTTATRPGSGGSGLYTQRYRWTSYGFDRFAVDGDSQLRAKSRVRTPLREAGVLLQVNISSTINSSSSSSSATRAVHIDFFSQLREFPAAQIDCTATQWRFPSNMDSAPCKHGPGYCARNCWNWYAPRAFANESTDFVGTLSDEPGSGPGFIKLFTFRDIQSRAVTALAVHCLSEPTRIGGTNSSVLGWNVSGAVAAAGALQINIAVAFGSGDDVRAVVRRAVGWASDMPSAMQQALDDRQTRYEAVFGVRSGHYSGSLPILVTDDAALKAVYYGGVTSMLELERTTATMPAAPPNTSHLYITGAGSNASTNAFFWDQSYCATVLSMLNPDMMRSSLLQWMRPSLGGRDAAAGWGVDFFSGRAVGNHYAANDMTLFKLALHYVQQTGEFSFMDELVAGRPVLAWMTDFATAYRNLSSSGSGSGGSDALADYGTASALLECVPTYQHEVASFNAANVWMMESLATLLLARDHPGDASQAHSLRKHADAMAAAVLSLYVEGKGYWRARYPNGTELPVQHVIDFVYTSEFLGAERLGPRRLAEMNTFVREKLLTDTWMRALAADDPAAAASDRTDHGPFGAFDGWVALTVGAFARSGNQQLATSFLRNTSFVTTLGPYGQAHGIASEFLRSRATYKPFEFTLSNEHGGTDMVDAVITALFGLSPATNLSMTRRPPPVAASSRAPRDDDVHASLLGVRWQGDLYDAVIGPAGVRWSKQSDEAKDTTNASHHWRK